MTPLDEVVNSGLKILHLNDEYILRLDLNERSITHKLAEHYQHLIPGWHVDCEYNKNLSGPKRLSIDPAKLLEEMADFLDEQGDIHRSGVNHSILRDETVTLEQVEYLRKQLRNPNNLVYDEELDLVAFILKKTNGKKITKAIFPDIIFHQRGTIQNLAVVELKKTTNTSKAARLYDLVKLHLLVTDEKYRYEHAYFIDAATGEEAVNAVAGYQFDNSRFNPAIKLVTPIYT